LNDEFDSPFIYCRDGYDITKAVITATTVAITRDECETDGTLNGNVDSEGWTTKVVDCNTVEFSKGSDKITRKNTKTGYEWSYKGKTCKQKAQPDKNTKKAACRAAYLHYMEDVANGEEYYDYGWQYYYYQIYDDVLFDECIHETLPEDWWPEDWSDEGGDGYCDYYPEECYGYLGNGAGKIAAKPVAKALKAKAKTSKLKPLLKKRN